MSSQSATNSIAEPASLVVTFARFLRRTRPTGRVDRQTWLSLASELKRHRIRKVKDGAAWAPYVYKVDPPYRKAANVEAVTCLVLDIEDGTPLDALRPAIDPYEWVAYTTHSHRTSSPRYRVVFPLLHPIPAGEWKPWWFAAVDQLAGGRVDGSCKDLARLFYLPSRLPLAEAPDPEWAVHNEGRLLDPDEIDVPPVEVVRRLSAPSPRSGQYGKGDYDTLDVVRWFQSHGHYGADLGDGKHAVRCPWVGEHSQQTEDEASDTVIWEADGRWPSFHCSHAHCDGRGIRSVMEVWTDADAYCSRDFVPQPSTNTNGRVEEVFADELPPHPAEGEEEPDRKITAPAVIPNHFGDLDALVMTGGELERRDFPEPEQLVPHVLLRGFSTLLAGDSKLGKTSLVQRMGLASATGGWWLDRERRAENRLQKARVMLLNFEDPPFLTRERTRRMMAPEAIPDNFLVMEPPYGYSLNQILAWLPHAQKRFLLDAVILDPIAIAAEWEAEDDNAKVALTFKSLQRLAAKTLLALLSCHHVSKKPGEFGSNIRGASAIKANVMGWLVLEREKELFRLHGINKLTGQWDVLLNRSEDTYSWWIEQTRAGNTRTPQQAAKEAALVDLIELVRALPGRTCEILAELAEQKPRTCRNYLDELKDAGLVVSQKLPQAPGVKGPPSLGWFSVPGNEE